MRSGSCLFFSILLFGALPACAPVTTLSDSHIFEDEKIEKQAISQIASRHIPHTHVNVSCFNRRLLLTGEVPDQEIKNEIGQIAFGVANVRVVSNELMVGEMRGLASYSADSLITSDVKFRFMKRGTFQISRIKIRAENGTVFLMGQVSRSEGASAAELASTTKGVQQVVLLFDYLD